MEIWDMDGTYKVYSVDRKRWIEIQFEHDDIQERANIVANIALKVENIDERNDNVV